MNTEFYLPLAPTLRLKAWTSYDTRLRQLVNTRKPQGLPPRAVGVTCLVCTLPDTELFLSALEALPWARSFLPNSAFHRVVNRWEQSSCDTSGVKRRNRGGRQTKERGLRKKRTLKIAFPLGGEESRIPRGSQQVDLY